MKYALFTAPAWQLRHSAMVWIAYLIIAFAVFALNQSAFAGEKSRTSPPEKQVAGVSQTKGTNGAILLIGNQAYPWGPLETPVNDIRALRDGFSSSGMHTVIGENLGQDAFYNLVERFVREHQDSELLAFYYAGHAIQLNGRNYLIPVDARLDDPDLLSRLFDLSWLLDTLASAPAKTRFIILDSCRSNPFSSLPKASSGLSELVAPPNTLVAFSTAPGQTADDGDGQHSPYNLGLQKYLFLPETRIEDSLKAVRRFVRLATDNRQVPWENTSLEGEVVLIADARAPMPARGGKSAAPTTSTSPPPRSSGLSRDIGRTQCRQFFTKLSLGLMPLTADESALMANCK